MNMTDISLDGIWAIVAIVGVYLFSAIGLWRGVVQDRLKAEIRRLKKELEEKDNDSSPLTP